MNSLQLQKSGPQHRLDAHGRHYEVDVPFDWCSVVESASSPSRSFAEGTAAEFAAPAAVTVPDCGETSLPSHLSTIRLRCEAHFTYHFIWNLVTLGFALISLTSFSKWIFSGGASFISSLSYSVF